MITRIHNAELPIFSFNRKPVKQTNNSTPNGLWYSVNDDWRRFCIESKNYQWIYPFNYSLDVSEAKILRLSSIFEIFEFTEEYRDESFKYTDYINWQKVADKYQGIEIIHYFHTLKVDGKPNWYYNIDCASGCIWNLKDVKINLLNNEVNIY